ncbi:MAG: low molecular weight protein arginine phosphatase [Anaerolineae bacterium]|nr:low molecular weight protein arginine phosphatase [Anaerolineae bacterium]
MREVLFVCKGNTCRSPMAAALFRQMVRCHGHSDRLRVCSAGIWAVEGQPATAEAQKVMQERGLSLASHRAHNLTAADVRRAGVIVALERSVAEAIVIETPEAAGKVHTLGQLADDPRDVEDPIGQPLEAYRHTVEDLQGMLQRAYGRIMTLLALPL